jgi:hypothetical protein
MTEMATAIGDNADAATYATLHSNIVAAFATLFATNGAFADGSSQTGYALAFTLNLVPPALNTLAAQQFANTISNFDNHLATGFIGTQRLLPALHNIGRDDLAYSVLLQQTYPSWLYQVATGSTTMWETWDGSLTMSFNHYTFGSVGQYLYSTIGGINPAGPGYSTILIQPVPGLGLTWANTSYNSTRGLISTAWTNSGSAFNMNVVIPPNTTAQIYVPTTNVSAITESGLPAASSPGVSYVGISNSYAIYTVGSGNYNWSSPYSIYVTPTVVVTATNQTGTGTGTFYPSWTVVTNSSLIAGRTPTTATGNFSLEANGRNVNSLTAGGSLGISQINGTVSTTTSINYLTCGNSSGAGGTVIYTLPVNTNGYDLTNITVYGGWKDNGRDQQAYTVYYSTVAAPANFISLGSVNFTPSNPSGVQCATLVTLTKSAGVLATNAGALKFDFTNPASENGYCGYAAITVFGTPSIPPAVPAVLSAKFLSPDSFIMNMGSLVAGRNYTLQSTTNLTSGVWTNETNILATQSSSSFTNDAANSSQKFYRVVGY